MGESGNPKEHFVDDNDDDKNDTTIGRGMMNDENDQTVTTNRPTQLQNN